MGTIHTREELDARVAYLTGRPIAEAMKDERWHRMAKEAAKIAHTLGDARTVMRLEAILGAVERARSNW